ncbi:hypothetical protein JXA80_11450 [bacterium]|nr:hypothetical protein [candidate division CSSED10-310 bacterium]
MPNTRSPRIPFSRWRSAGVWLFALVVTLAMAVHQRKTGPTQPVEGTVRIDRTVYSYRLIRNPTTDAPLTVMVPAPVGYRVEVIWREYPTTRPWKRISADIHEGFAMAAIPIQPSAGKVEYYVELLGETERVLIPGASGRIIARYKDPVPGWALIPHILLMFIAMVLSNRLGVGIILGEPTRPDLIIMAFVALTLGGLIFGPIVQNEAFGAPWTGWPVGHDLTDNKIAVTWIAWLIAIIRLRRDSACRIWVLTAAIITCATYLVPHSLLGSQHNYDPEPSVIQDSYDSAIPLIRP